MIYKKKLINAKTCLFRIMKYLRLKYKNNMFNNVNEQF
jgi:hypothetical protein